MQANGNGAPGAASLLIGDILADLGASPQLAGEIIARAERLGVDPLLAIAQQLQVPLGTTYGAAARRLGFAFSEHISDLVGPGNFEEIAVSGFAALRSIRGEVGGESVLFAAPDFLTLAALARAVGADDPVRGQICIVPPDALSRALTRHTSARLFAQAVERPGAAFAGPSARIGARSVPGAVFLALLGAFLWIGLSTPLGLHPAAAAVVTLVLVAPSAFRLWATMLAQTVRPLAPERMLSASELPLYSVLVPLRDEAHMVEGLVRNMSALDYPPEKLDIKFVVESASPETIAAVARHTDDPRFSLVVVPEGSPATKPKALNYALPLVRGRHLVVFDAEDEPEPDQLRKAASLFAERDDLVCLQAALTIHNADRTWITRMFAAEYAGHFDVLLPAIAYAGLPMPLGGTSNHFRTAELLAVGAWDPFNVTEDADLGFRLARAGKACASLESRTYEEAPLFWHPWHRQRGRWMKGWMQTLIVHNADPVALWRDLGPRRLIAANLLLGGMVVSAALHGVFLLSLLAVVAAQIASFGMARADTLAYFGILLVGYLGAAASSVIGLERTGRRDLIPWLATLPAYWLIGSLAALSAVWGLVMRPFYWAKTTHAGERADEGSVTTRHAGASIAGQ